MKQLLTSLLIDLAAYVVAIAVTPALILCHFRQRVQPFDAANCADYLNTDGGTNYTAAEIDAAYKQATEDMRLKNWIDQIEGFITG